jgi:threonyl-tRNA synthetase
MVLVAAGRHVRLHARELLVSSVSPIAEVDDVSNRVLVTAGTTCADAIIRSGLQTKGPRAVAVVRVDGQLRDLSWMPECDVEVEAVFLDSPDGLNVLRHSTAHVLAQAVQDLFPDAKLGIGPPIVDGFYYDFAVGTPFVPEDIAKLEKRMQEIIKSGQLFVRRVVPFVEAAKDELANEPFKIELLNSKPELHDEVMEIGGAELTIYDNVDGRSGERRWSDLCRGPHLLTTAHIPAFKLLRTAAAYWLGSADNTQLQRIYGTAWPSRDALKEHLHLLEEAAKRDHRKLGEDLDLFSFPEDVGPGLVVFHPKGGIIRRELENYSRLRHEDAGYEFVNSPNVAKAKLFEKSGHLQWYADGMFPPMETDGERYYLKPMSCPFHNLIFMSRSRSYRELPLRLFEFGGVYRWEKSGVVHGLTRVRGMTQDDSHIYCTREQMVEEVESLLFFVLDLLRDYGLDDFYLELSTRDDGPKFIGELQEWEEATQALQAATESSGLELVADPGGAAFYGPKISVQARDAIGRSWQMSTIQVDLQLPQRFDLAYTAADGSRQRPVMIHRALFGSIERFFGILTEHYAGAFPAWLAPIQVVGIPVSNEHVARLSEFVAALRKERIRAQVDGSPDRMQKKIRNAQKQKIPFMVIVGDDDATADTVSFRYRDGTQWNRVPRDEAIAHVVSIVRSHTNISPSAAER